MTYEPKTYAYSGAARVFRWHDLRERDVFVCRCGWTGVFREMSNGWFEELIDGSCPTCDTMLAIRSFATLDEIREAAAAGNSDAADQLREIEARQANQPPS